MVRAILLWWILCIKQPKKDESNSDNLFLNFRKSEKKLNDFDVSLLFGEEILIVIYSVGKARVNEYNFSSHFVILNG